MKHSSLIFLIIVTLCMGQSAAQQLAANMPQGNRGEGHLSTNKEPMVPSLDIMSGNFEVTPVSYNSPAAELWPRIYGDNLVITSNRKGRAKGKFFDLYIVEQKKSKKEMVDKLVKLRGKLKSPFNDASPVFTKDGKTVYFTRNNANVLFFGREKDDISRLNVYKSIKRKRKWGKPELVPFASETFSTAHPMLNPEEDKLYFVSDMPGGYGGSDLYEVVLREDGSYGEPKNLGSHVNTAKNETAPFVSTSDLLVFASQGHPGYGGMDLFALAMDGEGKTLINLGPDLNTKEDDFGLILNADGQSGYFNSARDDGKGDADIYAFTIKKPLQEFFEERPVEAIAEAAPETDKNKDETLETSKEDGENQDAIAVANSEDLVENPGPRAPAPDTELVAYLSLKPVLFDFDSEEFSQASKGELKQIAAYLKELPDTKVVIVGHTDNVGPSEYNKVLSVRRANQVRDFLLAQGIPGTRVSVMGMGEDDPLIDCDNCTRSQRRQNRRAEIKVRGD